MISQKQSELNEGFIYCHLLLQMLLISFPCVYICWGWRQDADTLGGAQGLTPIK